MSTADTPLLVTPAWLHARLDDPSVRVLDCTTWMTPQPVGPSSITSGRPDWLRAHIPGSQHVCMVQDLSDPAGAFPYTLPGAAKIAALLSRLGIDNGHHVVLYGAAQPMVVTRAWWVLTALGHQRVSVLDGGLPRWQREGRPLTDAVVARAATAFQPRPDAAMVADAERVARAVAGSGERLVNALSAEQFAGTGGAHYGRPGRIPGSLHVPARDLVDPTSMDWLPQDALLARLQAAGLTDPNEPVITYCGGGIAASVTFFALRLLGRDKVALYDNSLLEWSADPARPMVP
ncbi:MAG: sulfurtransferase [Aquabacterium sp.]|nr:sulfurtransferase [Aquabacterium sp.]